VPLSTGQRLLRHDRRLGVRFVAGADEAGRGSLAGPLVVAGVLLDYKALRGHRVRPLALLNDSKQVEPAERERLYHAVVAAASRISIRVIAAREIDANGPSSLEPLGPAHRPVRPPSARRRVPGRRDSGSARSRRRTEPSSTATRRAPRSRPRRSSRR
jgi:ribonuclease HII